MLKDKEIIYTEAASKRIEEFHLELKSQIEAELRERNFVPGAETVEVTGSDVDEIARNMRLVFFDREEHRSTMRDLIVRMYFLIGIVMLAAGLLYPYFTTLIQNPVQLALVLSGLLITLGSYMMYIMLRRRDMLTEDLRSERRSRHEE